MGLFKNLDDLRKTKVGALLANQHLYALGAGKAQQPKCNPLSTLERRTPGGRCIKTSVGICVTIIACGHRELDEDNLIAGAKPLRDSIAASIGIDDADKRIFWEYRQILTRGAEGTLVLMSTFDR